MATYTDSFSSGWATLKLIVTTESQSIANNISYLKCVLKITKDKSCSSHNNGGASISMTIAGDKLYSSSSFDIRSLSVGSTKTLATKYITVSHSSDGTKSVTCKASFSSGVSLGSASISKTYTCETIPRKSTITSAANVTLGNVCSVKWTPKSSSFRYKLKFSLGDWSYTTGYLYPKKTTAYTYTGYTIPSTNSTLLKAIPKKTGTMSVTLYTYTSSGTSSIDNDGDSFTVTVPQTTSGTYKTIPTVGTITPTIGAINYNNGTRNDILVKTKSKITIEKSGTWSGGYGATTSLSYTISGPGFDSKNNSNSTGKFTSYTLTTTGKLTYTITVKDSRGYTNSKTITYDDNNKLYCYDYFTPSISNFKAWRCNKDKSKNTEGTYINCSYTPSYAPVKVNGTNTNTYKITFSGTSSSKSFSGTTLPISLNGDIAGTYTVKAVIEDSYGAKVTSSIYKVYGATRVMNVSSDGTGIAFGQLSEESNCLESKYKVVLRQNGTGLFVTNSSNKAEAAIFKNSDNLWIGSTETVGTHITGGTYISTGDKRNLYVSKLVNDTRTNYAVLDGENYKDYMIRLYHSDGTGYVTVGKDGDYYYFRPYEASKILCGSSGRPWYKIYTERLEVTAGKPEFPYIGSNGSGSAVDYATNMYVGSSGIISRTTNTSSRTIKHDIKELEDEDIRAERLYDINVYQAKYNEDILSEDSKRYLKDLPMFIIEEMNEVYPAAVDKPSDNVKEWSWNSHYLIPPMLKLIQDQKKEIDELKERLDKLENVK